ncbi:uncharacterized protein LOC125662670 isoform X2 [Ostrea edulis]|nr:uncharacterized protein LOC125662670 isoform X2 [Ostrea edulis]
MYMPKKRENQGPHGIGYQVLFQKLLRCIEFRMQSQLEVPTGQINICGQEVTSKADIVGLKCDDPSKILFICEEKSSQVKRKCCSEGTAYSPVKKKRHPSADVEFAAEVTSSGSESLDMPSNVHAQHIGELLSYLECSVTDEGLLGMVIQKTDVMFTYLKIDPESVEKIKRRKESGPVTFDTTKQEDPVFFYTKQFNLLRREDRRTIFKTLVTIKMMEKKVCCTVL